MIIIKISKHTACAISPFYGISSLAVLQPFYPALKKKGNDKNT